MAGGLDGRVLAEILDGTSTRVGEEFFDDLVKHLARGLGTKCAWVTEWLEEPRRLRALSFYVDGEYVSEYEYAVENTPCEPVVERGELVHVPERVLEIYSHDPDLPALGAVSYIGAPLFDVDGGLLGHLAVLHSEPMPRNAQAEAVFRIFASRAAAELRRVRRDRALVERERKLSRLLDGAMDAIVELTADRQVTQTNEAARRIFGVELAADAGVSMDRFLNPTSRRRLEPVFEELVRPGGPVALPLPLGITCVSSDGTCFAAEGTVSRLELEGQVYFTLVIRNVEDRLAAEARIESLVSERDYLRSELDAAHGFSEILGESSAVRRMLQDVERVAGTNATVLVTGETGTGKELVARAIHSRSPRAKGPLVRVNCAAIPSSLQESEFFGHERGAFTGATQRRDGRFKLAHGGTLFLDEVGELPLDLQAKLLRVLQEGEFEPVGSSRTERVDVRIIAATNRQLEHMVREGTFRQDLLYRLNVFPVEVPPLRERGEDVVLLAEAFLGKLSRDHGAVLAEADRIRLRSYDWPGNVRELYNVIERAIIVADPGGRPNLARALPARPSADPTPDLAAADRARVLTADEWRALERTNIQLALEQAGGKVSGAGGAATLLGVNPNTLASRMKALGIARRS